MSVGIMDADMAAYTLVPFNLEVMKYSAYYKKKNQMVILTPTFTPEKHQLFIYRKDYNDGDFPLDLLSADNVNYGGYAFSNNSYYPLPLEIEKMKPDTSIYEKMEKVIKQGDSARRKKIYQNMMTAEHLRLSLDGEHVWEDYERQLYMIKIARNIMFHDYDLNQIEGGFEEVQRLMSRARVDGWATKVGMKFPVRTTNGEDLLKWSSLNTNSTFYSLRYDGVIEDDAFLEWVGVCRDRAVFSQVEYYVTHPRYTEDYFTKVLLRKILRQVIISRSYRVFFLLRYDEDFFTDKRWCNVLRLFNTYHNSFAYQAIQKYLKIIETDTVYDFVSKLPNDPQPWFGQVLTKEELREVFYFVREKNFDLFKDFYECNVKSLGGKL